MTETNTIMPHHRVVVFAALSMLAVILAGCDLVQHTQTKETPEFIISVTVSQHPLVVGEKTDVYATLRRGRGAVSGCRVRIDSAAEGTVDASAATDTWQELTEQGSSGVYRGVLSVLPPAGAWETEFAVKCLGREQRIAFSFDVVETSN